MKLFVGKAEIKDFDRQFTLFAKDKQRALEILKEKGITKGYFAEYPIKEGFLSVRESNASDGKTLHCATID